MAKLDKPVKELIRLAQTENSRPLEDFLNTIISALPQDAREYCLKQLETDLKQVNQSVYQKEELKKQKHAQWGKRYCDVLSRLQKAAGKPCWIIQPLESCSICAKLPEDLFESIVVPENWQESGLYIALMSAASFLTDSLPYLEEDPKLVRWDRNIIKQILKLKANVLWPCPAGYRVSLKIRDLIDLGFVSEDSSDFVYRILAADYLTLDGNGNRRVSMKHHLKALTCQPFDPNRLLLYLPEEPEDFVSSCKYFHKNPIYPSFGYPLDSHSNWRSPQFLYNSGTRNMKEAPEVLMTALEIQLQQAASIPCLRRIQKDCRLLMDLPLKPELSRKLVQLEKRSVEKIENCRNNPCKLGYDFEIWEDELEPEVFDCPIHDWSQRYLNEDDLDDLPDSEVDCYPWETDELPF